MDKEKLKFEIEKRRGRKGERRLEKTGNVMSQVC